MNLVGTGTSVRFENVTASFSRTNAQIGSVISRNSPTCFFFVKYIPLTFCVWNIVLYMFPFAKICSFICVIEQRTDLSSTLLFENFKLFFKNVVSVVHNCWIQQQKNVKNQEKNTPYEILQIMNPYLLKKVKRVHIDPTGFLDIAHLVLPCEQLRKRCEST